MFEGRSNIPLHEMRETEERQEHKIDEITDIKKVNMQITKKAKYVNITKYY